MPDVRIATFNVENLGEPLPGGVTLAERIALLRPQLLRLRADILCLQEVDGQAAGHGERARRLSALDALLAETPYADFHRVSTVSASSGGPRDKHNLVTLSRWPLESHRQIRHALVPPPLHRPIAGVEAASAALPVAQRTPGPIEWERPILLAAIGVGGRRLHVINVHLRAPRAAFIPGQKTDGHAWRTMAGWAEGFFLAAVKRAGQALEARLLVDDLFDAEAEALIVVAGDFNADSQEMPLRTIRGDEEDAGNPHLASRTLVPVDRSLADSRRFSVVHHGRPQMLDHMLVSRPLLAWYRGVEVHNEALGDELVLPQAVRGAPESFHAPLVAEFAFDEGGRAETGRPS